MSEKFNFKVGRNAQVAAVIAGLVAANEVASDLESATAEVREIPESVTAVSQETQALNAELTRLENEKNTQQSDAKKHSKSPEITVQNLFKELF